MTCFPSFHSWNFLSSIGSGITFLSFAIFSFSLESYPAPGTASTCFLRDARVGEGGEGNGGTGGCIFFTFPVWSRQFLSEKKKTSGISPLWFSYCWPDSRSSSSLPRLKVSSTFTNLPHPHFSYRARGGEI